MLRSDPKHQTPNTPPNTQKVLHLAPEILVLMHSD
jgi:hypothetical protein